MQGKAIRTRAVIPSNASMINETDIVEVFHNFKCFTAGREVNEEAGMRICFVIYAALET